MITDGPPREGVQGPDDGLREAIVVAVKRAPAAHSWGDVLGRSPSSERGETRGGRTVLFAVAASLVLGVLGFLVVVSQSETQTVRTDDPAATTQPIEPPVVEEPVGESLPTLPEELDLAWSTTIEGSYPQSPVRIDDTIVYGQQDLPGVRAIDARSGELLWSFTIADPDPNSVIVSLHVVEDRVLLSWMDSMATQMVTALDAAGVELWTVDAVYVSGAVISGSVSDGVPRTELIGADGLVRRSIVRTGGITFGSDQFVVEDEDGFSWYGLPDFARIAGPTPFAGGPGTVFVDDHIVTLEESLLRVFDVDGEVRAELAVDDPGVVQPVGGERPGVLVTDPSFDVEGSTTFYEFVDDAITEVWARPGRFVELVHLGGDTFVVQTETVDGSSSDTRQSVIDVATGDVVLSNDLYDSDGASNGFVFVQLDNGPNDVQTVAYDEVGQELWRLRLDGRERAEIVDGGVLVAIGGERGPDVEITFYE